ncbi:hypothetical protein ABL78_7963 [Leptomonas seymouri]|uniref:MSP domain-containing protein n=1 Tax=Leptomonas seymouri TaxID=5684 RepID=A0A0N0P2J2_LEPSE|nr:hypothetical protein ABL78_7963 [Leptomonas seymouri]|eukprot:KPI83016.1 hypothetical protein ABL78_7963 [Leptomonas seymouri]
MSLTPSCANLYFPAEPRDNVVALRWDASDAPLEPNTSVIFKVKCTAPQRFHVTPRYGALLLADVMGATVQYSNKVAEIVFGLRENHVGAAEKQGGTAGNGALPSAMSRASTSRMASVTPGGPAYQERFSIEYVVIKSEPLAFQQILNSLTDYAKLAEVVKSMWSLVASGAIPRAHIGAQASINMKVFMENVVLNRNDPPPDGGDGAAKIVVPPEARLVVPTPPNRQSRTSSHNQSSAMSRRTSENATPGGTPSSSRRKAVDELRALKEEIHLMRRDSSSSLNGSPQNLTSPHTASTPSAQRTSDARQPVGALSPSQNATAVESPPAGEYEDVIMKFDYGREYASGDGEKQGLKVYVVLAIMFTLYVLLLILRRGSKHSVAVTTVGAQGGGNARSMQLTTRNANHSEL